MHINCVIIGNALLSFQILHDCDVEEEKRKLTDHCYNSSSELLWKCKLIPVKEQWRRDSSENVSYQERNYSSLNTDGLEDFNRTRGEEVASASDPCNSETHKVRTKYRWIILLGVHHGITDGYTSCKISNCLMRILQSLLKEEPVDHNAQLGVYMDCRYTIQSLLKKGEELLKENWPIEVLENTNSMREHVRSIVRALGQFTTTDDNTTEAIPSNKLCLVNATEKMSCKFSIQETSAMLKICKKHSITVNSLFCALINLTILQLATHSIEFRQSVSSDTEVLINTEHTVNLRQYWPVKSCNLLGTHVTKVLVFIRTQNLLLDKFTSCSFWPYCNSVHETIKRNLTFENVGMRIECDRKGVDTRFVRTEPRSVYSLTNMRDMSEILLGGLDKDIVRFVDYDRQTSNHKIPLVMLHYLHTFKGQLTHSLTFNTKYLSQTCASALQRGVAEKLSFLIRSQ